jgi:integrase
MPRIAQLMTALQVKHLNRDGMHFVGGAQGLILQIRSPNNPKTEQTKSWILRARLDGKRIHLGLGRYPNVSLTSARELARTEISKIQAGTNPIVEKRNKRLEAHKLAQRKVTFKECALEYMKMQEGTFSNEKHKKQWGSTLETYVFPLIGNQPISELNHDDIRQVLLQKIADGKTKTDFWNARTETASRVRGRVQAIIDYAIVSGIREKSNPAIWKGHLDRIFAAPNKIKNVEHHPALPYVQTTDFMKKMLEHSSVSSRAIQFLVFTSVRPGSVRKATWSQIDFQKMIWNIPPQNMKNRKEFRVPLAKQAIDLLLSISKTSQNNLIFPSPTDKPLSDMALSEFMRGLLERGEIVSKAVPHGFRSTFRDWAAEQTNYPDDLRKMASSHSIGDAVFAAYQRSDLLEKRRALMNDWADFVRP